MSDPKTDATQMGQKVEKSRNTGAPSERPQQHRSSMNAARKTKKKSDSSLQLLAGWLLDNQTGTLRNPTEFLTP
jgi:hypothetical protein